MVRQPHRLNGHDSEPTPGDGEGQGPWHLQCMGLQSRTGLNDWKTKANMQGDLEFLSCWQSLSPNSKTCFTEVLLTRFKYRGEGERTSYYEREDRVRGAGCSMSGGEEGRE